MAGSYEKINYSIRPAKSIERKMMSEALQRLREAVLQNHPRATELRKKSEMTFAARENLRRRDGAHRAAGKSAAAVVTDPDEGYRTRTAHAGASVESSSSA